MSAEDKCIFQYNLFGEKFVEVLHTQNITAYAVDIGFLCVGTDQGYICLFDAGGNIVEIFRNQERLEICALDMRNALICSGNKKGHLYIYNRNEKKRVFKRLFSSGIGTSRLLASAKTKVAIGCHDGSVYMLEKNVFLTKSVLVFKEEGSVLALDVNNNNLIWVTRDLIRVFSLAEEKTVFVMKLSIGSTYVGMSRMLDDRFFVYTSRKLDIWEVSSDSSFKILERAYIVNSIDTIKDVEGVCQINGGIVLLCSEPSGDGETKTRLLYLYDKNLKSFYIDSQQIVTMSKEHVLLSNGSSNNSFYVLYGKSILKGNVKNINDLVLLNIKNADSSGVLELIGSANGGDAEGSGEALVMHYLKRKEYGKIGKIMRMAFIHSVELWEKWIHELIDIHKIHHILKQVPTGTLDGGIVLSPSTYDAILRSLLQDSDEKSLMKFATRLPIEIYNARRIMEELELRKPHSVPHLKYLRHLYQVLGEDEKLITIQLQLKQDIDLNLITEHNMTNIINQNAFLLIDFSSEKETFVSPKNRFKLWKECKFLKYLTEQSLKDTKIIEAVRGQVIDKRKHMHVYMDSLFDKDATLSHSYYSLQLSLYAEFDRDKLKVFITKSRCFDTEKAAEILRENGMLSELVSIYILHKDYRNALSVLINDVNDIKEALCLTNEINTKEVWAILLKESVKSDPLNLMYILNSLEPVNTHIDFIIDSIPTDTGSLDFSESLLNLLLKLDLHHSILQSFRGSVHENNIKHKISEHSRWVYVPHNTLCISCSTPLLADVSIKIFPCGHHLHSTCIVDSSRKCPICLQ